MMIFKWHWTKWTEIISCDNEFWFNWTENINTSTSWNILKVYIIIINHFVSFNFYPFIINSKLD